MKNAPMPSARMVRRQGFNVASIDLNYVNNRACPSASPTTSTGPSSGNVPASLTDAGSGVSLIENINLRPYEPVMPNLKPYRQHERRSALITESGRNWALEARWDRRRLDHVIEDASLADPDWGEIYTIVNPGEGVNANINTYANFLQSLGSRLWVPGNGQLMQILEPRSALAPLALPTPRPSATTTELRFG